MLSLTEQVKCVQFVFHAPMTGVGHLACVSSAAVLSERERAREREGCVCLQSHTSTCTHSFIAFYTAFVERTGACSAAREKKRKVNIYFYESTLSQLYEAWFVTRRAPRSVYSVALQSSFSAFCDKVCLSRSVEDVFEDKM